MVSSQVSLLSITCCCAASIASTNAFSLTHNASTSNKNDRKEHARKPFRNAFGKKQSGQSSRDDFSSRLGAQAHDQEQQSIDDDASSDHDADADRVHVTEQHTDTQVDQDKAVHDRRKFMHALVTSTAAFAVGDPTSNEAPVPPAEAYQQNYPVELEFDTTRNLETVRDKRISVQKAKVKKTRDELSNAPLGIHSPADVLGSVVWGAALWFLAGSRSNPAATPLANLVYDDKEEKWLRDRNDGFFADLPAPFLVALSFLFLVLGVVADRSVYFLAEGDSGVSLQLAGVSLIGGAVLEVGRIASGEKQDTRDEYDRDTRLAEEFSEFADRRVIVGSGNCHRSDIVRAFRRFNPKYRTANNPTYPLADIEIERLLKNWNRISGSRAEMSSAGFFTGIQVNEVADVFAPR